MALVTAYADMRAGKSEGGCAMIERAGLPTVHGMTTHTSDIKRAELMIGIRGRVICGPVAAHALFGRSAITGSMAINAHHRLMSAG